MAVGRLSGAWIWEILRTQHPGGVLRRVLLDEFASLLVSPRSSRGSKGRIARRLYSKLAYLQRSGLILQEDGIIRPLAVARKMPKTELAPLPSPILQKRLFLAMLAEDRNQAGENETRLHEARWDFIARAIEEGWTQPQAAAALGLSKDVVQLILGRVPKRIQLT